MRCKKSTRARKIDCPGSGSALTHC
eukprot:COSAG05_NODE_3434_length_2066_cov_4.394001_1_plen_24_part_10